MVGEVDVEAIRRFARRRVIDQNLWEDVAQTACLYALIHREARPWQYVLDALRRERRRAVLMERPERVASHYPTEAELGERLFDETLEDEKYEWDLLPAAERDRLVAESCRALGCSE